MNVKEYIESGILEAYVLGALTPGERAEVAANIAQYPELADEVATMEQAMQQFAEANAVEPPVHLQNEIWGALQKEEKDSISIPTQFYPGNPVIKKIPAQAYWQRAAIWIVLAGSLLVNFLLWSQNNSSKEQQLALQQHLDSMQAQQQILAQAARKEKEMIADPGMQTIIMHTAKEGHPMAATVYWSKDKGEAYVSIEKLPMPPTGMQYQMWVIQDGKPVDMGVLPDSIVKDEGIQKLPKLVNNGQAFAISLEKEGGSPTPTMANIYVMGKVAS